MDRNGQASAIAQIGTLFRVGTFAGLGDGALLDQYLGRHGEAAELAFSAIVERHGPMVLRVCRRTLGGLEGAEDAFQATFLALARGAATLRRRDSLASWLHGTALRVSACARSANLRRRGHESRWAGRRPSEGIDRPADDLGAIVHEEVGRLPSAFRAAVVLCDLEGLSIDEAARRLGCPPGTVKSRVARGRDRLRWRLARRGLAPAVGVVLAREATGAIPARLAESAARAAMAAILGRGGVAASVEALLHLNQRSLMMGRWKSIAAGLVAVGALAAGSGLWAQGRAEPERPRGTTPRAEAPKDSTYTKTYMVSDLVLPILSGAQPDGTRPKVDMRPLVELLTESVAPGTWRVNDGMGEAVVPDRDPREDAARIGSITPFFLSISLIVRHTPEVHAQFERRLGQLRGVITTVTAFPPELRANYRVRTIPDDHPHAGLDGPHADAPRAMPPSAAPTLNVPTPLPPPAPPTPPSADLAPPTPPIIDPSLPRNLDALRADEARRSEVRRSTPRSAAPGTPAMRLDDVRPDPAPRPRPEPAPVAGGPMTPAPRGDTERRLRSLEEKLDRLLKALDVPKDERRPDNASRR